MSAYCCDPRLLTDTSRHEGRTGGPHFPGRLSDQVRVRLPEPRRTKSGAGDCSGDGTSMTGTEGCGKGEEGFFGTRQLRGRATTVSKLDSVPAAAVLGVVVDLAPAAVETDGAALLFHVDFKLAAGAAALPAVVVVAQAVQPLAGDAANAAAGGEADEEEAGQCAAELGESVEAVGPKEHGEGDEGVDGGEITGLDVDDEEHHELGVAEEDSDGDEQAEDAAHAAVEGDLLHGVAELVGYVVNNGSREGGAEHGGEVEADDPAFAAVVFEKAHEEPEGEQFEECAEDGAGRIDETVGEGLPEPAVEEVVGHEGQIGADGVHRGLGESQVCQREREVGDEVDENEAARGPAELRKPERHRPDSRHRNQVTPSGGAVSFSIEDAGWSGASGDDNQAAMASGVDRAYAEDDIVFGDGHGDVDGPAGGRGNVAHVLPAGHDGVAPEELVVVDLAGGGLPGESGRVFELVRVDPDVFGFTRREGKRGQGGGVQAGNLCDVGEVYELHEVA